MALSLVQELDWYADRGCHFGGWYGLCNGRALGYGLSPAVWCSLAGDAVGASRLVEFGWSSCRLAGRWGGCSGRKTEFNHVPDTRLPYNVEQSDNIEGCPYIAEAATSPGDAFLTLLPRRHWSWLGYVLSAV